MDTDVPDRRLICVEHLWVMGGMTLAADGTHIDYACQRCAAVMVAGPAELRGEV